MIRPYVLAETNWKHLKDENIELAVLPWGATEAHNYHLPYATDNIEGKAIAEESARIAWDQKAKVIVLPVIPFGVNTGQSDIYLDINLNPSTQFEILKDIIQVLDRQGIKKFMILNSHGGNDFKSIVRELGLLFPNMFICVTFWPKMMNKLEYFDALGDHADEMQTSLILHLSPELVLPKSEWGNGTEKKNRLTQFSEDWAWAERPWSKVSEDTGIGDPKAATKDKGERFFKDVCYRMSKLFIDLCTTKIEDLYK
jgi:creatinine amidohydrolase